jgi:hypothetical protein
VQSRLIQHLYGHALGQMVAWETLFLLRRGETNGVFNRVPILQFIAIGTPDGRRPM